MSGHRDNFSLLEPTRNFAFRNYLWRGLVVPRQSVLAANNPVGLSPYQQIEDRFTVPAGSWLVGYSAFSAQSAGFKFQVFDVGANDYALSQQWESNGDCQDNSDTDAALPHILPHPYCIVAANKKGEGILQVKLVNAAAVSNDVGLVIHLACPVRLKKGAAA
jgi:hypothetical protein